ncbi:MAG: ATP-binding cassette domain-containing protein [Streptosporangiales bacterium]|nr:ATP-binding cassette domain-containing protein [Streptosporangiales bacterium]
MTVTPTDLVEADNVTKAYSVRTRRGRRDLVAVDQVSLRIAEGKTVGLVGESGCGKSTLGRLLLNLERASSGSVTFDGQPISGLAGAEMRKVRRDVQIVFQDPYASLNSRMTVGQLVAEPFRAHGLHRERDVPAEVATLLDLVGLPPEAAKRYPRQLSGGQRQRVAIARAVALRPRFVVCDEPVSALDVSVQAQVINLLRRLQRELGLTYLFISHDLAVVRYLCDETAVMYLGHLVEQAPTAELFADPRHPYTQILLSAIPVPDPELGGDRRIRPQGEVPSPLQRPSGCAFRTRCPLATERCVTERPELRELSSGHLAACHYAETADVKGTM